MLLLPRVVLEPDDPSWRQLLAAWLRPAVPALVVAVPLFLGAESGLRPGDARDDRAARRSVWVVLGGFAVWRFGLSADERVAVTRKLRRRGETAQTVASSRGRGARGDARGQGQRSAPRARVDVHQPGLRAGGVDALRARVCERVERDPARRELRAPAVPAARRCRSRTPQASSSLASREPCQVALEPSVSRIGLAEVRVASGGARLRRHGRIPLRADTVALVAAQLDVDEALVEPRRRAQPELGEDPRELALRVGYELL